MKKTAVDYLVNAWAVQGTLYAEDIVKAKEIEKQQIIDAFLEGCSDNDNDGFEYYNETYKK